MSEYHVASYIAYAFPKHLVSVRKTIESIQGAEIHADDEQGRLVVTIEGQQQHDLVNGLRLLENIPHMLSVAPIYHEYIDEQSA